MTAQDTLPTGSLRWLRKPIVLKLLAAWFILTLPIITLLTINGHARFVLLEMATHYRAKFGGVDLVFIGDSLTAGGRNWGWRMVGNPLGARNLAGDGYTIRQIQAQAYRALQYHPHTVLILAGTNDILGGNDLQTMATNYQDLLKTLQPSGVRMIVTLVPFTTRTNDTARIRAFNTELRPLCAEYGAQVVDLNPAIAPEGVLLPEYATDTVHFSQAARDIWTHQLRDALKRQPPTAASGDPTLLKRQPEPGAP